MSYKRILTIQDISCVGQCSLTVALPILSACGLETAILPSAVLSTHTAGFSGYTFRDLSEDMPKINQHWTKENIKFSAVYTGYLGSSKQVDYILDIVKTTLADDGVFFVDPAMADNGKLYPGFDNAYVLAMLKLCRRATYIIPNITEACFLTGYEFKETYDKAYIDGLIKALQEKGCNSVILTGVSFAQNKTGVIVAKNGNQEYYEHQKLSNSCHGTGDIYASCFVGAFTCGKTAFESAKIAADFTVRCIAETAKEQNHWYGAKFETELSHLIDAIK